MKNPIARYLMCAYAYYEENTNLIPDAEFVQGAMAAKDILANYDKIEHMHKHLVTKKDLEAGTYLGKYPKMVIGATRDYMKTNII